jgi:hypothetical protein
MNKIPFPSFFLLEVSPKYNFYSVLTILIFSVLKSVSVVILVKGIVSYFLKNSNNYYYLIFHIFYINFTCSDALIRKVVACCRIFWYCCFDVYGGDSGFYSYVLLISNDQLNNFNAYKLKILYALRSLQ